MGCKQGIWIQLGEIADIVELGHTFVLWVYIFALFYGFTSLLWCLHPVNTTGKAVTWCKNLVRL
jgi:hypothetical protein